MCQSLGTSYTCTHSRTKAQQTIHSDLRTVVIVTKVQEGAAVLVTNSISSFGNVGQIERTFSTKLNCQLFYPSNCPCWATTDWLHRCPDCIMRLEVLLPAPVKAPRQVSGDRAGSLRPDQTLRKSSLSFRKGSYFPNYYLLTTT